MRTDDKTYEMKPRTVPLDDAWDVIVLGGGPAGSAAAAAAAREGARTLLVEATGTLGGMATSGLVTCWCPFSDKEKVVYGGLAERVFNQTKAGMPHVPEEALDWVPIDPELLKRIYDELVLGSGAEILFNTQLAAVETGPEGAVSALVTASKAGLAALRARTYVDCTGDADLAAWAGAEFQKGDGKGRLQPGTLCFVLSNVDEYAYRSGPRLRPEVSGKILDSGRFPLIRDHHLCNTPIGPGTVGFNAGHVWDVDNTDPESVSKALVEGRKIAAQFREALAEFHPKAFANAFLVATAGLMGIRETRRIVGDYVLTAEDYVARRSFPDEICRNSYWIDIHVSAEEADRERRGDFDMTSRFPHYGPGESHGVPYRCLTPKGLVNTLVAGRSISCDRAVQGSVRVMPVCLAMGEAAGVAAAFAARSDGRDVHAVDVKKLRARLKELGAYLPGPA